MAGIFTFIFNLLKKICEVDIPFWTFDSEKKDFLCFELVIAISVINPLNPQKKFSSFDLKDACFHIIIHPMHKNLFKFLVEINH